MAEETKEEIMDVEDDAPLAVRGKKDPKDHHPWVEKYRPKSLDELIAHEEIIQILNR